MHAYSARCSVSRVGETGALHEECVESRTFETGKEAEDEKSKLDEASTAVVAAKKLADQKFAEEEKETGR